MNSWHKQAEGDRGTSSDQPVALQLMINSTCVPQMMDNTIQEEAFLESYSAIGALRKSFLEGRLVHMCVILLLVIAPLLVSLLCLTVIILGLWALPQGVSHFPIIPLPATVVVVLSVLLIVMGVAMITTGVIYVVFVFRCMPASVDFGSHIVTAFVLTLTILGCAAVVIIIIGITAAVLSQNVDIHKFSANETFNEYLNNPRIQETWDSVQKNLGCCGVVEFTDYIDIYENNSVPVSCCNTTNPFANMTTCPHIVGNALLANQTGLIYSEGCVFRFESSYRHQLVVTAGVSITTGVLQIIGGCLCLPLSVFVLKNT